MIYSRKNPLGFYLKILADKENTLLYLKNNKGQGSAKTKLCQSRSVKVFQSSFCENL